jgi:hypothetical protein
VGAWIVIFIAFALMGSFFWIMPSKRDRVRMELRQKAMRLGLKIRFPDKGLKERLIRYEDFILGSAMYELFIVAKKKPLLSGGFFIIKDEGGVSWRFLEVSLPLNLQGISAQLLKVLEKLPVGLNLVMLSSNGVSMFWDERGDESDVECMFEVMEETNASMIAMS